MFHIGRSGSTVLGNLLGQHSKIFWDGELYERLFRSYERQGFKVEDQDVEVDPVRVLRKRMHRAGSRFYGCEIKFFHLTLLRTNLADYVTHLHRLGFSHFIVLKRKNYLRVIVSAVITHKLARPHQSIHETPVLTRIELNVNNVQIDRDAKPLLGFLRDYDHKFSELEQYLGGHNMISLTYEDDILDDPYWGYQRVCRFLGIPHGNVTVSYGKTNPFTLNDILLNFDEVARNLKGTAFEWMLYE